MAEEDLVLDKLASGDRPSILAAGTVAAQALKEHGVAVLMTDVLGRVFIVPSSAVEVKRRPRIPQQDLDLFDEEEAIRLLTLEEAQEEEIFEYLRGRGARLARGGL